MWPLAVLVGEILPKIISYTHADGTVLLTVIPLRLVSVLLFPFVYVLTNVGRFIAGLVGAKERRDGRSLSREELRILVTEGSDLPTVIPEMREMIERIFDFKSRTADQVMVPLDRVTLAPIDCTVGDIRRLMEESGHSRIPLMDARSGEIPGYVRAVDLVGQEDGNPAVPLVCEPLFTRPPDPIDHLLPQFQTAGRHLALVRERTGKVVGILTLEDVLEEIVGEIEDEFD
jgi:putative hemolysin